MYVLRNTSFSFWEPPSAFPAAVSNAQRRMLFCYDRVTFLSTSLYFLLSFMRFKPVVFIQFPFFQQEFPKRYVLFQAKPILHRSFFTKSLQLGQAHRSPCRALNSSFLSALVSPLQAQPLPGWPCALDDPVISFQGTRSLQHLLTHNLVFAFALQLFNQVLKQPSQCPYFSQNIEPSI